MKLHLPRLLRRAVMACLSMLAAATFTHSAEGAIQNSYTNRPVSLNGTWSDGLTVYGCRLICNENFYASISQQGTGYGAALELKSYRRNISDPSTRIGSTLTNSGRIEVYANEVNEASEFYAPVNGVSVEGSTLNNAGEFSINSTSLGGYTFSHDYACGLVIHTSAEENSKVTNSGSMNIYVMGRGISAEASSTDEYALVLDNSGELTISALVGLDLTGVAASNSGSMTIYGGSNAVEIVDDPGMYAQTFYATRFYDAIFENTGRMNICNTMIISQSDPYGAQAYFHGIFLEGDSHFYNSGELNVDCSGPAMLLSKSSFLHLLHGSTLQGSHYGSFYSDSLAPEIGGYEIINTLSIVSNGTVTLGGSGQEMAAVEGGSLITVNSDLDIFGGALNLEDDVTLNMGGNLTVANDVTRNWGSHSLTIDNGGTVRDVYMEDALGASWDGAYTLSEEESGLSLTTSRAGEQFNLTQGQLTNSNISATNISISSWNSSITLDSTTITLGTGTNTLNVTFQGTSHIDSNLNANLTGSTLTNRGSMDIAASSNPYIYNNKEINASGIVGAAITNEADGNLSVEANAYLTRGRRSDEGTDKANTVCGISGGSLSNSGSVNVTASNTTTFEHDTYVGAANIVNVSGIIDTAITNETNGSLNVRADAYSSSSHAPYFSTIINTTSTTCGISGGTLTNNGNADVISSNIFSYDEESPSYDVHLYTHGISNADITNADGATLSVTAGAGVPDIYYDEQYNYVRNPAVGSIDVTTHGVSGGSLTNSGTTNIITSEVLYSAGIKPTAEGTWGHEDLSNNAYGISSTDITNEAGATFSVTSRALLICNSPYEDGTYDEETGNYIPAEGFYRGTNTVTSYGISGGSLTNRGSVNIDSSGVNYIDSATWQSSDVMSYGIADTTIINEDGATLTVKSGWNIDDYYDAPGGVSVYCGNYITGSDCSAGSASYGIYGGSLTNSGRVDVSVSDSVSCIEKGGSSSMRSEAYGIANTEIINKTGGILSIKAEASLGAAPYDAASGSLGEGTYTVSAYGISGGTLTNSGTIDIELSVSGNVESGYWNSDGVYETTYQNAVAYMVGIANTTIFNEAGGVLTVLTMKDDWISDSFWREVYDITGSTLTNRGTVNADFRNSTIYNEAGGILNAKHIANSTIYNKTGSSLIAEQIGGTIINEAGASLRGGDLHGGSLSNSGTVELTTHRDTNITNEATGSIVVQASGKFAGLQYASTNLEDYNALINKGILIVNSAAGAEPMFGVYLHSSSETKLKWLNDQGAYLAASGSDYGIYANSSSHGCIQLYNAGTLNTSSVYMTGSGNSTLYLLNGSTTGAYTEGSELTIQGGKVQLGGELGADNGTISALADGSVVNISSGLSFSGGMLTLADNVTLAMGGDLTVADDVTHSWNGYTLTVDNGGVMHSVTMGGISLSLDNTVSFTESSGKVSVVQNGGGSSTVNGGSMEATGSLNMGSTESRTELKSDTDDLSLSASEGGTVTNTMMEAVNIAVSGTQEASLKLDNVTMTVQGGTLTLNNVEMTNPEELELSADKGGAVSNTTMEAASITVSGSQEVTLKLDTVTVTVQGGTLTLNNVEIRGVTTFQNLPTAGIDSMVTAVLNNVTFVLGEGNSVEMPQMVSFGLADAMEATEETEGSSFLVYSNMLENLNVNGNLTLDLSSYYSQIANNGYDSVGVMFTENTAFADDSVVTATFDGKNLAQAYKNEDGTMYFTVKEMGTVAVPEPTTATLSLLALTALAARRRRRA